MRRSSTRSGPADHFVTTTWRELRLLLLAAAPAALVALVGAGPVQAGLVLSIAVIVANAGTFFARKITTSLVVSLALAGSLATLWIFNQWQRVPALHPLALRTTSVRVAHIPEQPLEAGQPDPNCTNELSWRIGSQEEVLWF